MSDEVTLYYNPRSRAQMAHYALEEVGAPYKLVHIDLEKGENRKPDFLKINPMGKIPTIVHRDTVVTEAAAIIGYLADAFPAAGLTPALDDPRRGTMLRWLVFGASSFEPALVDTMMKRDPVNKMMAGWGDWDDVLGALEVMLDPGPWVLGDQFSAADIYVGAELAWAKSFGAPGLTERPKLLAYIDRITTRPAYQRTIGAVG
ncbi:MAG: glutathione S-transferase family protein [Sphingomonadales bacterium]|nr:MAG: glutathione S-transferase family protein [Sphingomonadales bacterium]